MSALAQTRVLGGRTLRRSVRSAPVLISTLVFPVLLMYVQAALLRRLVDGLGAGSYIDRLTPLIIIMSVLFGMLPTGVGFLGDLRGGLLNRVRSMPVSAWSLVGGRVLADVVRILAAAAMTVVAALPLGFGFARGPLAVLAFFGVVAAFGTMATCVALMVTLCAPSEELVRNVLGGPALLLSFASSGFVPLQAFPEALRPVVAANPVSMAVDALNGLAATGPAAPPAAPAAAKVLLVCAVVAAVAGTVAVRRYSGAVRSR